MNSRGAVWALLLALLGVGAFLRYPQIYYGYPAAVHPDTNKTVVVGQRLAEEWRRGRCVLDPGIYQYATLYPYTIALMDWLRGRPEFGDRNGRWIAMCAGLFSVVTVFMISRALSGYLAAFLGAGLVSFGFLFLEQGRHPIPDPLQMFWVGIALYFLMRKKRLAGRDLLYSGFSTGLAVGSKYTALLFLAPVLVVLLWRDREDTLKKIGCWGLSCVAGFWAAVPMFIPRYRAFMASLAQESLVQRSGEVGTPPARFLDYLFSNYVTAEGAPFANSFAGRLGIPFTIAALLSLGWCGWQGWRRKDARQGALVVSCLLTYVFFSCCSSIHVMRFMLPWAMLTTILVSLAFADFSHGASRYLERWGPTRINPAWFALILELTILVPSLRLTLEYRRMMSQPDTRLTAEQWILGHIPVKAKIFNFMWGPGLPTGRYEVVSRPFPNYRFQIRDEKNLVPRLTELRELGVSWVIWNSFYTKPLLAPADPSRSPRYFQAWRNLYSDLRRQGRKSFEIQGRLSPDIEIYDIRDTPAPLKKSRIVPRT